MLAVIYIYIHVVVCFIQLGFRVFWGGTHPPGRGGRAPGPEPIGGAAAPRNSADRAKITLLAIIHIHVFKCVCGSGSM